jgi:predicted permease
LGRLRGWIARLRGLLRPGREDALARDEMQFHIDMEVREGIARGLSPEEARRVALRNFGGVDRFREQAREARWAGVFHGWIRDARISLRGLVARPGYSVVSLATLALGIGATTAFFALVNGVLLRPLPYPESDLILRVRPSWSGTPQRAVSPAEFLDLEDWLSDFDAVAGYAFGSLTFTGDGQAERARAAFASSGVWEALGVAPALGRVYTEAEDHSAADVIVLTDGFWRARFGSDPDVVGRTIRVSGVSVEVLGVLPPDFIIPEDVASVDPVQVLAPLGIDPATVDRTERGSHFILGLARLGRGMAVADGVGLLNDAGRRMVAEHPNEYPADMSFGLTGLPLLSDLVGPVRPMLLLLMGAVALAFAIVWANIANLQLSRVASRSTDIALRRALGASRGRIISQVLIESLVLAAGGAVLGVLVALGATELLGRLVPGTLPRVGDVEVDATVLGFGIATALMSGVLSGVGPAFYASRGTATSRLGSGHRETGPARSSRLRRGLVTSQVAVAVMLAASAALVTRSLVALSQVDPGYRTENVISARVTVPTARYPENEDPIGFFQELVRELETIPGVTRAGAVTNLPLATRLGDISFELEEERVPEGRDKPDADWQVVTPGYFETLQIRVVSGRTIQETDRADAPGVVVINHTMAELHWPGRSPLGRRIRLGGQMTEPRWAEVVGVVDDVRHTSLAQPPRPQMYFAHRQFRFWSSGAPARTLSLVAQTTLPAADLGRVIRTRLAERDPELALYGLTTLAEARGRSMARSVFTSALLAGFSGLALLLALVGVYGVMMYSVRQQVREFGIRIALGAAPRTVVSGVLRNARRIIAVGVTVGLVATLALSTVLRRFLFGVSPTDPASLAGTVAAVGFAVLLAAYVPARLASRSDPVMALRSE